VTQSNSNYKKQHTSAARDLSALIEGLKHFKGSSEEFLQNLLAAQCTLAGAEQGVIFRKKGDEVNVAAIHPKPESLAEPPGWVSGAAGIVRDSELGHSSAIKALLEPDQLYGQPARRHVVFVPLKISDTGRAVAAFLVESGDRSVLTETAQRLELTGNILNLYELRLTLGKKQTDLNRLRASLETLAALNQEDKFKRAAMRFCNELATTARCERVSFGLLKGRYVKLQAISSTEHFSRKMKLVQDTESAMEECVDQDIEIRYPAFPQATYVNRTAEELSKKHGPLTVLTLPLRRSGEPVGAVTLERPAEETFTSEQVETLRLVCELCTPRLMDLYQRDRWFGAKAASKTRSALAVAVGPEHTWAKIAAVLIFAAAIFLTFARGQFKVEAPFVIKTEKSQLVPAPYEGVISDVYVEVGDQVKADQTVLVQLDTADLRWQLAAAKAEKLSYQKQADAARRESNTSQTQIAEAKAQRVAAEIDLLEHRIDQSTIKADVNGTIVEGELKRRIRAPVEKGEVLFKIASMDSLRPELLVSEEDISYVHQGQHGDIAPAYAPGTKIKFVVERISPAAEVVSKRNVFRVYGRMLEPAPEFRPGLEGVAKVSIEKRSYAWIWTRRVANWIRMKLWL